jgi:hypothetical protein
MGKPWMMDLAPVMINGANKGDGLTIEGEVIGVKITTTKKRYVYHQHARQPNKIQPLQQAYLARGNQTKSVALTWTCLG